MKKKRRRERKKSLEIIPIDLPRHDHHPEQKHRSHDQQREHGLPIITYALRLQPRQRGRARAVTRCVRVAVAVHTALGAVQLYRGLDQAGEPKDEEDEGAEDDDAGEELALGDEDKDDEKEEEGEDAGGDHVGEYPVWYDNLVSLGALFLLACSRLGRRRKRTRSRKRTRARLAASSLALA